MGMYDTVIFVCPKCGCEVEHQSKAGECTLREYPAREVPFNIAGDIAGDQAWCGKCQKAYLIGSLPHMRTVHMVLIPHAEVPDEKTED